MLPRRSAVPLAFRLLAALSTILRTAKRDEVEFGRLASGLHGICLARDPPSMNIYKVGALRVAGVCRSRLSLCLSTCAVYLHAYVIIIQQPRHTKTSLSSSCQDLKRI